jgi:hypothetical protein
MRLEIWRTKMGRKVLTFKAFDPKDGQVHKLLWWDDIDQEIVMTDVMEQLQEKIEEIEIDGTMTV